MTVRLDDVDTWAGPAASVVVCNGASFGGGMHIAPGARPDDGLLDVVRLGALGRLELARWLPTVYWRRTLANPHRVRRAARVRVDGAEPLPVQLDGELGAHTPLDVEIHPGALSSSTEAEVRQDPFERRLRRRTPLWGGLKGAIESPSD